jgi:hypothetical protein
MRAVIESADRLASVGYLVVCLALVLLSLKRGERIFQILKAELSSETWSELGSPDSLWDLFKKSNANWRHFIRNRVYESHCSPEANAEIRAERKRIFALFSLALALGLLLVLCTQLN